VTAGAVEPRVQIGAAILALLLGVALAVASASGPAVLIVLAVGQALLVLAVCLGTELPGRIGALALAVAASAAADVVLMRWTASALDPLLAVLAVAIPLMFAHQLVRGMRRVRLTASLSGVAALIVCVVGIGAWLQLDHEVGGTRLCGGAALAVGIALGAALLVDAAGRGPRVDVDASPTVAGLAVGVVLGAIAGGVMLNRGAHLGVLAAFGTAAGLAVLAVLLGAGAAMTLVSHAETLAAIIGAEPADVVGPADPVEPQEVEPREVEPREVVNATESLETPETPEITATPDAPAPAGAVRSWARAILLVVPVLCAIGPVAYVLCLAASR
jgi:hypothetical protein